MSAPASCTLFPESLKEATSIAHRDLERLALSESLLQPTLTRSGYLLYLDLMHDIISQVETSVFPLLWDEIDQLGDRKKEQLLLIDFEALGYSKTNPKRKVPDLLSADSSSGFAMGIMYVVEGSTLGGRVIYKSIQKSLGLDAEGGASYFAGYGEHTGRYWKEFMKVLADHEKKNKDSEEIIAGANHAFGVIKRHFVANSES